MIVPSRASTAQTLSGDVGYSTPSTIRIDPRIAAGPPVLYSPAASPTSTFKSSAASASGGRPWRRARASTLCK
jgi:hypothetical protein